MNEHVHEWRVRREEGAHCCVLGCDETLSENEIVARINAAEGLLEKKVEIEAQNAERWHSDCLKAEAKNKVLLEAIRDAARPLDESLRSYGI